MANVQIAVGLRREARLHATIVFVALEVFEGTDKVDYAGDAKVLGGARAGLDRGGA